MSEFDGIDPQAYFEQQARLFQAEKASGKTYEEWTRACDRVMQTQDGRTMIEGAMRITGFYKPRFSAEDDYNPVAAAARDGAAALVVLMAGNTIL